MDRRRFLQQLGVSAAALSLPMARLDAWAQAPPPPLDILILGGTRFLGPALVDAALAGGHTVTLFNRGKSAPDMYPDLETIIGDRDGDLEGLKGRSWDLRGRYQRLRAAGGERLGWALGRASEAICIRLHQVGLREPARARPDRGDR